MEQQSTTTATRIRGGQFIVKTPTLDAFFTLEDLSEDQKMMRESTKEFAERELWAHWERFEQKDYDYTKQCMQKAGELGLLSIAVPEAYGGMGMGFVSTMLVCDYISGVTGSFSTAFGAHTGIGTMPITLYGTEEQKQKYVPRLASGEWFGSYCLTEPGAGSDANSGKTKAVLSEDGSHYLITGQKMWISNAGFANLLIVFARIEDDKYITGFIVENDPNNGITFGEEEKKLGIHSSSTRQVFFNDTKVPVENMLSERGNGFKIAMNALNVGRIKLAAACLDAERRVIREATKYAKERVQFKTPIANFGAIKEKLALMASNCYADESACYRAASDIEHSILSRLEKGESHQEAELKGVEEFAIECSILKVIVSEHIQSCSDEGLQIYGGMGFSADAPMESAWRDARISRIYEGTNEINRMLSVGMLIKKALKGHVDLLGPAYAVKEELMGIPSFDVPDFSEALSQESDLVKRLKKVFLMVAGAAVEKYGTELESHQMLLMAAADILIEIYMAESAVYRTLKNIDRFGADSQTVQIAMTELYVFNAVEHISKRAKEGIASFAEGDEQKAMLMGLKRFTKYHKLPNITALKELIAEAIKEKDGYVYDAIA
ncbi:MAG: acyl-CoA dehydrogenase family protein [Flavobacteriaceae bacterium]|nr:acyl-CoA dehydrogenase family protein [Flavobacteriaceae bacterium]